MADSAKGRVLVTGGAGYIGSVLVRMLLEQNYDVRVLDRLFWGRAPLKECLENVEVVHADIRNFDESVLDGVDFVSHLAGLSNDPTADYSPEANWQMNAHATERLAEVCSKRSIRRFVFGSSCSVYDGLASDVTHDETAKVDPRGGYTQSKLWAEQRLLDAAGPDFHPVVLRQGTVYGPSPRMRFDLVVNTFLKDALRSGRIQIHGEGEMYRPLIDVRDVARAHIAAIEAPDSAVCGEIFNILYTNYQIRELARVVHSAVGLRQGRTEITHVGLPATVRDYRCSNEKFKERVGFEAEIGVEQSVEDILDAIEVSSMKDFDNPYYYNLPWMRLLEDVFDNVKPFDKVF